MLEAAERQSAPAKWCRKSLQLLREQTRPETRDHSDVASPSFSGATAFEQHGPVGEDVMGSMEMIDESMDNALFARQQDAELFSGLDLSLDWYSASFNYVS